MTPAEYERRAKRHPGGFAIPLGRNQRPFWTKGWTGCHFGCGKPTNDAIDLKPRVTYSKGLITMGWYCK